MSVPKRRLFLVIRYGLLEGFDAVDEIEKIIKKRGRAYFGKYGQPFNKDVERIVAEKKEDVYVILIRREKTGGAGGYVAKTYKVISVSRNTPEDHRYYPSYYQNIMSRFGTWLEVQPYDGETIDLRELVTKSSLQPLLRSLSSSMRGHFFCRSK